MWPKLATFPQVTRVNRSHQVFAHLLTYLFQLKNIINKVSQPVITLIKSENCFSASILVKFFLRVGGHGQQNSEKNAHFYLLLKYHFASTESPERI